MSNDHGVDLELVADDKDSDDLELCLVPIRPVATKLQLIVGSRDSSHSQFQLDPDSAEVTKLLTKQAKMLTW